VSGRSQPGPVVALDVDGVIRILRNRTRPTSRDTNAGEPELAPGAVRVTIAVAEEQVFRSPFHAGPSAGTIPIVPAGGVGGWINRLLASGIEVVWASTWEHTANWHLAPLLGIPELPVATVSTPSDGLEFRTSAEWKAQRLLERYRGRDLVWVDDNLDLGRGETVECLRSHRRDPGLTLTIAPDPDIGITSARMAEVDAWLATVAAPEGRTRLRAEQARMRRRQRAARARQLQRFARRDARVKDAIAVGLSVEAVQLGLDADAYRALLVARAGLQAKRRYDPAVLAGRTHFVVFRLRETAAAPMGAEQAAVFAEILRVAREFAALASRGDNPPSVFPALLDALAGYSPRALGAARRRMERLHARLARDVDLYGSWVVDDFVNDIRTALASHTTTDPDPSIPVTDPGETP